MTGDVRRLALETPLVLEAVRRPGDRALVRSRRFKVKPLLTPDDKGAIYADAVLELIDRRSKACCPDPYIGMPPNPRSRRGYIDTRSRH